MRRRRWRRQREREEKRKEVEEEEESHAAKSPPDLCWGGVSHLLPAGQPGSSRGAD